MNEKILKYLDILSGFAFDSNKFNDKNIGMPLVRIRDLAKGRTETNFDGDYDSQYLIRKGDFLIGMDGEFKIHEWKGRDALLNQRVSKLINFSNEVIPRYFYYLIRRELQKIEDTTPFVTVKHISKKQILNIEIPVPDMDVQKQIVAILEKAERLKEKREQANQETNKIIQSVFYEMFGDPIRNEKDWILKTLEEVSIFS